MSEFFFLSDSVEVENESTGVFLHHQEGNPEQINPPPQPSSTHTDPTLTQIINFNLIR